MLMFRFLTAAGLLCSVVLQAQNSQSSYELGLKLKKEKKTREALAAFEEAVRLKPGYTEALYETGWCRNELEQYKEATAIFREVRKTWPQISKLHFELGYAFEKSGMYDSALTCYFRCLELNPDYKGAYKRVGYVYYHQDRYTDALNQFGRFEEIMAGQAVEDYLYWYRKGFMQNAQKAWDSALVSLNQSLLYKKDYLNTYLELGYASSKLKKGDDAIGYFRKAMEVNPSSHVAYNGIAEVFRDIKRDMDEAMNWYRSALKVKPNERKACFGMGYCLNSKGQYRDAIPYLRTALEMEKDYVAAHVELGYSYFKTGEGTLAIQNLQKALELNPENLNARYYLCLVYISRKEKANAQRMVDELRLKGSKYAAELQSQVDKL